MHKIIILGLTLLALNVNADNTKHEKIVENLLNNNDYKKSSCHEGFSLTISLTDLPSQKHYMIDSKIYEDIPTSCPENNIYIDGVCVEILCTKKFVDNVSQSIIETNKK